jgi:primary-amine oxidase
MLRIPDRCRRAAGVCLLLLCLPASAAERKPRHPLDPLTKDEITTTVRVLLAAGRVTDESRFPILALNEPPKDEVLKFKAGKPFRREAFAVVFERAANKTFEAVVDLHNKQLLSWKYIPDVQPPLMPEDMQLVDAITRADPRWQEAMRKRGFTDLQQIAIDPWPAEEPAPVDQAGMRLLNSVSFYKGHAKNYYARPIEGPIASINLNTKGVYKFIDTGVVPLQKASADLDVNSVGKLREAPKPLHITQPRGIGFEVRGQEVRWQNWRFRYGVHPREGLVLYTIGYEDQGKLRSILYRASLSELFVPYGDPSVGWSFRNVFDMGKVGIGWLADSLEPLADAPENASLFSAVYANELGAPVEIPRAVAIYERDGGLLWKHFDYTHNESRRARQLVVSFLVTAGNYEYGLNWIFHQDGTLEAEVLLTGIMAGKGVAEAKEDHDKPSTGHLVTPYVQAVHHQHFFNFRLDLDIDDAGGNSVVEMNAEATPGRNELVMKETTLPNEKEAQRRLNLATNRSWKVINPCARNAVGGPAGYMLVPGENAIPFVSPTSSVGKRAGFIQSHLWVTPYDPAQMNAAGYYIVQKQEADGLPRWTQANRSVENEDVVLWYTLGVTHIPRPEEWPVMPVHRAGFRLIPCGFFSRNPALNVPKPETSANRARP